MSIKSLYSNELVSSLYFANGITFLVLKSIPKSIVGVEKVNFRVNR